jgi:hypothetical protein
MVVSGEGYNFTGNPINGNSDTDPTLNIAPTRTLSVLEGGSATFQNQLAFRYINIAGEARFNNVTTSVNPFVIASTGKLTLGLDGFTLGTGNKHIENAGQLVLD